MNAGETLPDFMQLTGVKKLKMSKQTKKHPVVAVTPG
jgi:hypothetical protein